MIILKTRHNFVFKAIAVALLCLFIVNDVVWANPDIIERDNHTNLLQIPLATKTPPDEFLIEDTILKFSGSEPDFFAKKYHVYPEVYTGRVVHVFGDRAVREGNIIILPCILGENRYIARVKLTNEMASSVSAIKYDPASMPAIIFPSIKNNNTVAEPVVDTPQEPNSSLSEPEIPSSTTLIPTDKEIFAPKMDFKEYSSKVAWWLEELIHFSLPMIISHFTVGIGSHWSVLIMLIWRGVLFFLRHPSVRSHAPPQAYAVPLAVTIFGVILSAMPVIFFGVSQNPVAFIIGATSLAMLFHNAGSKTAFACNLSPATIAPQEPTFYQVKYDPKKFAKLFFEKFEKHKIKRDDIKPVLGPDGKPMPSGYFIPVSAVSKVSAAQLKPEEKLGRYLEKVANIVCKLCQNYGIELKKEDQDTIAKYLESIISQVPEEYQARVLAKFKNIAEGKEDTIAVKMENIDAISVFDFATNTISIDPGILFYMKDPDDPASKNSITTISILIASIIGRQFFGYMCRTPEELRAEESFLDLNNQDAAYLATFFKKAREANNNNSLTFSTLFNLFDKIKGPAEIPYTSFYAAQVIFKKSYNIPDEIHNRYIPLAVLGEGGMGLVLLATDKMTDEMVAIKIAKVKQLGGEKGLARFRREIEETKKIGSETEETNKIDSQSVVRIVDEGGSYGEGDDCHYYYVMEYYPWPTLEYVINHNELSIEDAVKIIIKALKALEKVHEKDIIHRDIKPANMMVRPDLKRVVLMDLGLGKEVGTDTFGLTEDGTAMGTPDYIPPEQAVDARTADFRSDLFSMGVMLYEMVTGRRPFRGPTRNAVMLAVMNEEPESPSVIKDIKEPVDQELNNIIMMALEKKREDRYQSAHDMLMDLAAWLNHYQSGQLQLGGPKTISKVGLDVSPELRAAAGRQVVAAKRPQRAGAKAVAGVGVKPLAARQRGAAVSARDRRKGVRVSSHEPQKSRRTLLITAVAAGAALFLGAILTMFGSKKDSREDLTKPEPGKSLPDKVALPIKPEPTVKPESLERAIPNAILTHSLYFKRGAFIEVLGLLGRPSVGTISCWIKTSCDKVDRTIPVVSIGGCFSVTIISGNVEAGWHCNNGWVTIKSGGVNVSDKKWHNIVFVNNPSNSTQKIYIDGIERGSGTDTKSIDYNLGNQVLNTQIGRHGQVWGDESFEGDMADVRVYSRALNSTEASILASGGGSTTGLEMRLEFNESQETAAKDSCGNVGTTVKDSSGNGHNGTAIKTTRSNSYSSKKEVELKKPGGGAWWNNPTYMRWAWLETLVVLLLTILLPENHNAWAWLLSGSVAGGSFWLPHLIGNRQAMGTSDVIDLSIKTFFVAALLPYTFVAPLLTIPVVGLAAGLLTVEHRRINLKHLLLNLTLNSEPSDSQKIPEFEFGPEESKSNATLPGLPMKAGSTRILGSHEGKASSRRGDWAIIQPSPIHSPPDGKEMEMPTPDDKNALRDLTVARLLAKCFKEESLSLLFNKKVVFAFDSELASRSVGNPLHHIKEALEELKKEGGLFKNIEIVIAPVHQLPTKLNKYIGYEKAKVFMFANAKKDTRKFLENIEPRIESSIYIDENGFEPEAYFPIAEIVVLSLAQYFNRIIKEGEEIAKLTINGKDIILADEMNIDNMRVDKGALIVKLIPEPEKLDTSTLMKRYANIARFLTEA